MSLIEWFRTKFIPKCSDSTIAALIFLYNKYGDELVTNEESKQFVVELKEQYSKPMEGIDEVNFNE